MSDKLKLVVATLPLVAALTAFYYFSDASLLLRILGLVAAVAVGIAIAMQTAIGKQTMVFLAESRTEVRKVVWPDRKETLQTTGVVMVMVVVVALFLWGVDVVLLWAVRALTGQGA